MDSKITIILLLIILPSSLFAQNRGTKKYIDSSELQLKTFASEMFYEEQVHIADTLANKKTVDYFGPKYFQESNYSLEAIQIILAYSKEEAKKDFESDELGKCLCYNTSLRFFISDKLDRKVKSLRKYLTK